MSKFYIGQKVVAVVNHSQGVFKKGDEFTVLDINKGCCFTLVDIGIQGIGLTTKCSKCGARKVKTVSNWLFSENRFAPIELSEITFEDVIKIMNPNLILN